ncbi:unnamed protein product, partial [Didymodactylos carnosus]
MYQNENEYCALCFSDYNINEFNLCPDCNKHTRQKFYELAFKKIGEEEGDFDSITQRCQTLKHSLSKYSLPSTPITHFNPEEHRLDEISETYFVFCDNVKDDEFVCVYVPGDGSCLYTSITTLLSLSTTYAIELRVKTLCELALNVDKYIDKYGEYDNDLPKYISNDMIKSETWGRAWDIFALCTVLNFNIRTIYPNIPIIMSEESPNPLASTETLENEMAINFNSTFTPLKSHINSTTVNTSVTTTNAIVSSTIPTINLLCSRGISAEHWFSNNEPIWESTHYCPLLKPSIPVTTTNSSVIFSRK